MKWTGFTALACAAAFTVACNGTGRDARDTDNTDTNRSATADIRGDDTVGTSGQAPATRPGQVQATGANMHGQDGDARYFAEHAAMSGNAEVELGQLATQRAQNAQVKEFGQMMVRDHSKSGAELKQALSTHSVAAPSGIDPEHRQLKDRLSSLSGAEFDREYMKAMVEGHKEMQGMLKGRANQQAARTPAAGSTAKDNPTGTSGARTTGAAAGNSAPLDMAVNQWASKTLPAVEQHLQKAEQIYSKVR
jgi:predicted outer membrane protein